MPVSCIYTCCACYCIRNGIKCDIRPASHKG